MADDKNIYKIFINGKACNNNKKLLKALNNLLYEIVNSSVQYDYDDDFLNAVSLAQEAVKKVEE